MCKYDTLFSADGKECDYIVMPNGFSHDCGYSTSERTTVAASRVGHKYIGDLAYDTFIIDFTCPQCHQEIHEATVFCAEETERFTNMPMLYTRHPFCNHCGARQHSRTYVALRHKKSKRTSTVYEVINAMICWRCDKRITEVEISHV